MAEGVGQERPAKGEELELGPLSHTGLGRSRKNIVGLRSSGGKEQPSSPGPHRPLREPPCRTSLGPELSAQVLVHAGSVKVSFSTEC